MFQIGIFFAVSIGTLTLLRALARQPDRSRVRRRLAGEFAGGVGIAPGPLYKNVDSLDSAGEIASGGDSATIAAGWRSRTEILLHQSGVAWSAPKFLRAIACSGLLLGGIALAFGGWLAGIAACAVGLMGPVLFVFTRLKTRRERYLTQLIGAFELMARVLRAGQSVPEAFGAAVEAFEDPLGSEFERCVHQIEHGLRPEAAYRELSERSGILDLRIFTVAMAIQRQTGGNVSEVLERLATVVRTRTRVRLRQKLRALTAEGRLQSLTLIVLPILAFVVMYFLNRQYAETLLAHWQLLAATAACMLVGVAWIRNIMNFEG